MIMVESHGVASAAAGRDAMIVATPKKNPPKK
jgi:hypothetical protein